MQALTKKLAARVLATVDAGLVSGLGSPEPGKMCVEAAVCFAYDLPHSDRPPCVGAAVRALKMVVNDNFEGSPKERAQLLRRLSIAQLGSDQIDQVEFAVRVALAVYQEPKFVQWANDWLSGKGRSAEAARAAADAARAAAYAAKAAAYAAAKAAAYAADAAAYAAANAAAEAAYAANAAACAAAEAAKACAAADAAVNATAEAAYAANAANAAACAAAEAAKAAAGGFEKFAEQVVQILVVMKSPGANYLYLTERENHVPQ